MLRCSTKPLTLSFLLFEKILLNSKVSIPNLSFKLFKKEIQIPCLISSFLTSHTFLKVKKEFLPFSCKEKTRGNKKTRRRPMLSLYYYSRATPLSPGSVCPAGPQLRKNKKAVSPFLGGFFSLFLKRN